MFELFRIIATRTKLVRRFARVTDDESAWGLVETSLFQVLGGFAPLAPTVDGIAETRRMQRS